jgi:photosystem II stability/assembly factor-like uncharacterized protein
MIKRMSRGAGSRSAGKNKKLGLLIGLVLLSASCNPFAAPQQAGIYKTVNGGADWRPADALKTGTGSLSQTYISKLAFDPGNNQTVFAGSYSGGLFKSGDAAATWSNVLSNIQVYDFAINPENSKIIYAAGLCVDHGCVLKTTDGGGSWNEVYHEGAASNPVRTVSINPQNPNQMAIGTTLGSVVKSSDAAASWQLADNFNDQVNEVLWQDNIYVLLKDKGMFKSTDLGATFTELTASLKTSYSVGSIDYTTNTSGVGTYHQAYVDATDPNLIYFTTDEGLYKSTDGGQTWKAQTLPVQPGQTAARAVSVANSSSNIVYASVGGTVYKSLDGGQTWQTQGIVTAGFVNYILIDPYLPQIAYTGIYINPSN